MEQNDLFAPPTKEELEQIELFAPPTKDELALLKLKDIGEGTVGAGKAVLKKAFEVADYPMGIARTGIDAASDVITGDSGVLGAIGRVAESNT
jgi:hypothetical protein